MLNWDRLISLIYSAGRLLQGRGLPLRKSNPKRRTQNVGTSAPMDLLVLKTFVPLNTTLQLRLAGF